METAELIRVLKEVPETRLRLIDLTWQVLGEDGTIDPEKVSLHFKEIKEAAGEAQAYSEGTKGAVECLKDLGRSIP